MNFFIFFLTSPYILPAFKGDTDTEERLVASDTEKEESGLDRTVVDDEDEEGMENQIF